MSQAPCGLRQRLQKGINLFGRSRGPHAKTYGATRTIRRHAHRQQRCARLGARTRTGRTAGHREACLVEFHYQRLAINTVERKITGVGDTRRGRAEYRGIERIKTALKTLTQRGKTWRKCMLARRCDLAGRTKADDASDILGARTHALLVAATA